MRQVVVGCPVQSREWIIEHWVRHAAAACTAAGADPLFLVVADPDDPTVAVLAEACQALRVPLQLEAVTEAARPDVRSWVESRKRYMVDLRNRLLDAVRAHEPDLFWSLDSDILADPRALQAAVDGFTDPRGFAAVGTACFLTDSVVARRGQPRQLARTSSPNYANLTKQGTLSRPYCPNSIWQVDVLMASKVMSPAAYRVDYAYDHHGEDIGWSNAARAQGLRLGWTSRAVSRHIKERRFLTLRDSRCTGRLADPIVNDLAEVGR